MTNWERARSAEQKTMRLQSVCQATARLFEQISYDQISLSAIAKEAGFTRSNLYKYFLTKEDIFLELISQDINDWRQDLCREIEGCQVHELTQIWVDVMLRYPRMLRLFAVLFSDIEKNCSLENLVRFKDMLAQQMALLCQSLQKHLPNLQLTSCAQFATLQMAFASGLFPMCQLPADKRQAVKDAGLQALLVDFETQLFAGTQALMRQFLNL